MDKTEGTHDFLNLEMGDDGCGASGAGWGLEMRGRGIGWKFCKVESRCENSLRD